MTLHFSFARSCAAAVIASSFVFAAAQQTPDLGEQGQRRPRPAGAAGPAGGPPPDGAAPEARRAPPDDRPIDEVVKDFTKLSGLVTIYRQKKDTTDTVYLEIPESQLGKMFLLQITSGSGLGDTSNPMVFHGMPIDDVPFRIVKQDDGRIAFVRPNLAHRSTVTEVKRMISRSFPDEVIGTFDVRAKQPSRKSILIDVGPFFKSDIADLGRTVEGAGPAAAGGGYGINSAQSYIDQLKVFPENAVIHTVYSLMRRGPAGSTPKTVPWSVSFNVSLLPDNNGYKPRLGDPRVGYFTQSFQSLDDQSSREQNVNYIERWDIQKADPKLPLSPPKTPIVFYIDNAVPAEFRDDVRRGLLMWNKAFERLGVKDAIVVKQMPDDADWDIADIRYNVVRWTTGMPFAIALMRANPLTGQILNASINFDGAFASSATGEYEEIVNPVSYYESSTVHLPGKYADLLCDMQDSSAKIGAEGENIFEALQTPGLPFNKQAYIHQRLAEVVCHELGHCLGLRHNFIASTQLDLKQLADPAYVRDHGTSASVMDYVPYNVSALKKKGVDYYQTTVGDYDIWAIEYGYTPVKADTPQGELYALRPIASKGSLPGHEYLSDSTADDYDPADVRYDMSADPLEWSERLMNVSRYLLTTAAARRVKDGKSYYDFTRSWSAALSTYYRAASYVPRFIGGVHLSNSFKGDPHGTLPIQPVEAANQRKALKLLTKFVFSESAFRFPKEDLAKLTFDPNVMNNEAPGRSRLFPMRSAFATFQASTLHRVFMPDVLVRIANNEFRTSNTMSLAELFGSVNDAVWSELSSGHEISDLRRDLQREHLGLLIGYVVHRDGAIPDDARALALTELQTLKSRIALARPHAKGPYGSSHLGECLSRINQALTAQIEVTETVPVTAPTGRRAATTP